MENGGCGCQSCHDCPLEVGMKHLAGRWKTALIFRLLEGDRRFSELERTLPGVSAKVLTGQLKALEDAEVLLRVELSPRNVIYRLTPFGERIKPALQVIFDWGATALANQAKAKKTKTSSQGAGVDHSPQSEP